jgi:hypothetical protein
MDQDSVGASEIKRKPTPRPEFKEPTHIKRENMVLHTWGDSTSGFVTDRVISSTKQLHVLEFELGPSSGFRHSPINQTIFAADILYFVLEGDLILANPETGEVELVSEGSGLLFHRETWNHGFSMGRKTTRVLEYFSPPPAMGAASEFSKRQPPLLVNKYNYGKTVSNWPESQPESKSKSSFLEISDRTSILSFRDSDPTHLISTLVATEFLYVIRGTIELGHVEDFALVERESVVYVLEGILIIDSVDANNGQILTSALSKGDAFFLPKGSKEKMSVRQTERAVYLRGSGEVPSDWKP